MEKVINRSIRVLLLSVQYFNSAIYCVRVKPICKMYFYTKSEVQTVLCLNFLLEIMAYLHCWTWIQVPTHIQIPNPKATLQNMFTLHGLKLGF